jgi:hypothetical protein
VVLFIKMKAASSNAPDDSSAARDNRPAERQPLQIQRGQVLLGVVAIVAIGIATTLALVLLNLITNHP